ncbi:MAG: glycosyltransferase family 2 protein [Candidatus Helarchaeota archaeon]
MNRSYVSIIIPCFNEVNFIKKCLESIIANDYEKNRLEIIVVDGMSTDGTREILKNYQQNYEFIRMIDNPKRHKPHALNLGIKESRGNVIIRMDAHAIYDPNYISKCVHYLEEYDADNIGGVRITVLRNNTLSAHATAYAISHPFAAGNAVYRTGAKEVKWVDTVFGGCYRREIFNRIGLFNEALIRGQDREFNVRLKRSGGRILFVPHIVCLYFARSDLASYIPWIYISGLTPFYISRNTKKAIFSWRNLIPLAFVLALIGT